MLFSSLFLTPQITKAAASLNQIIHDYVLDWKPQNIQTLIYVVYTEIEIAIIIV